MKAKPKLKLKKLTLRDLSVNEASVIRGGFAVTTGTQTCPQTFADCPTAWACETDGCPSIVCSAGCSNGCTAAGPGCASVGNSCGCSNNATCNC